MYPDFYGGTWSLCPDGVDFRYHQIVNIYADSNAYWHRQRLDEGRSPDAASARRQHRGDDEGRELVRARRRRPLALGRPVGHLGGDVRSRSAPTAIRSGSGTRRTGVIDKQVAEYWKQHYDLRNILETQLGDARPQGREQDQRLRRRRRLVLPQHGRRTCSTTSCKTATNPKCDGRDRLPADGAALLGAAAAGADAEDDGAHGEVRAGGSGSQELAVLRHDSSRRYRFLCRSLFAPVVSVAQSPAPSTASARTFRPTRRCSRSSSSASRRSEARASSSGCSSRTAARASSRTAIPAGASRRSTATRSSRSARSPKSSRRRCSPSWFRKARSGSTIRCRNTCRQPCTCRRATARQITLGNLSEQNSGLPRMPTNFQPADAANPYADYTRRSRCTTFSRATRCRATPARNSSTLISASGCSGTCWRSRRTSRTRSWSASASGSRSA